MCVKGSLLRPGRAANNNWQLVPIYDPQLYIHRADTAGIATIRGASGSFTIHTSKSLRTLLRLSTYYELVFKRAELSHC